MRMTVRSIFFSLACALLAILGLALQETAAAVIVILGTASYFAVSRSQASRARADAL